MAGRRKLTLAATFAAGCVLGALVMAAAHGIAQDIFYTTSEIEAYTPAVRDRLYAEVAVAAPELERHGQLLKTVIRLVSPTVVHIEAEKFTGSSRTSRRDTVEEAGSGVVIELEGRPYVLTNRHVVEGAQLADILVRWSDGHEAHPLAVWADPDTDVAVLQVPEASRIVTARMGNSELVEIGDFVLAVGSPFGLSHSVTYGIVSAKGRRDLELDGDVRFQDFIQTDAAINPGNSGGPLVNLRGELIGINTAIASSSGGNEGIGFSIPSNLALLVAEQLVTRGRVTRAFIGVSMDEDFSWQDAIRLGLPRMQGVRISGVEPSSPAAEAGIRINDVIIQFNGIRVEDRQHLSNLVFQAKVGVPVPVIVLRDRQPVQLSVRVGQRATSG